MRAWIVLVAALALFTPHAGAQEWSASQSEVLTFVEGCWAAWARAVETHDQSAWTKDCPAAENIKWWWMPDPVPETAASIDRQFAWQVENIERVVWWDVRPISIELVGDVAAVMFYAEGSWIATNGTSVDFGSKRLELFRRTGGAWTFMGGMVSPTVPSTR